MSECRSRTCVEAWPLAFTGDYDPRCCRFPKSCSAGIIRDGAAESEIVHCALRDDPDCPVCSLAEAIGDVEVKVQPVDLATWLTQIWDEDEVRNKAHAETIAGVRTDARIAADRQILALHKPADGEAACGICCYVETEGSAGRSWEDERWPCATIRLLAVPHAGRRGYREEWRP